MKKIIAKFNSQCAETSIRLRKGDDIYYDVNTRKAYHPSANKVREVMEAESIKSYIDAQENAYFERFTSDYYNY